MEVSMLCEAVALAQGRSVDDVACQVERFVRDSIAANPVAFDVLRGHLARARRLTRYDTLRLLANVALRRAP
jgi:hypothetical protein